MTDFYSTEILKEEKKQDFFAKEVKTVQKPKQLKKPGWVAEGLKQTGKDILGSFKDVPAQIADLLNLPATLLRTPRPPMKSKLVKETLPYIGKKIVEEPLFEAEVPVFTPRNIPKLLAGKFRQLETTPVAPTPLELGVIGGIPAYHALRSTAGRLQWNAALDQAIQSEKMRGAIMKNITPLETILNQAGIRLPKDLPLNDKVSVIISQARKSPTLGDALIKLTKGKIKPIAPLKPLPKGAPVPGPAKPIKPERPIKDFYMKEVIKEPVLAQEAMKYKTVEEFVAAQNEILKGNDVPKEYKENIFKLEVRPIQELNQSDYIEPAEWKQEYSKEMLKDIKKGKKLPPILINEEGDILDGNHRYEAYKKAGINNVQVAVATDVTKSQLTDIWKQATGKPTQPPEIQAFPGVMAPEVPPVAPGVLPPAEIIKRSKIIKNLGLKLDVPIRPGGFGGAEVSTRKAIGIYKPRPDIIRWKSGGVGTIAHEVGHFLDDNFSELSKMIQASRPEIGPLDYDKMKQRANEGFSEFLRYWVTQPEAAAKKAPAFHAKFEGWLNSNPDVRTILNSARTDYQTWLSMPPADKVKSQISFEPEIQRQGIKHTLDNLYGKVIDELAPLQRYTDLAKKLGTKIHDEDNPYVLARLLKGVAGKATHFLNHKTFNTKLEITGSGLREILDPVKNNLADFSTYLVARRVPELSKRGKVTGISKQDALSTIVELNKKYPQFAEAAKEVYAYQDRLLQYAFESGLIAPKDVLKMKEFNQSYVPFYRVFEELQRQGHMGDTLANLSSPIKRMTYRGSEREIIDPIENIMKNTYAIINTADRNAVGRGMIVLAKQHKELGRLFEKIATPLTKVATVDIGKQLEQRFARDPVLADIPEEVMGTVIDLFRPAFFTPRENVITVMQGGKKELYYVDPDIYKTMMGLNKEEISMIIKLISYPARWLRAGATTLSPEFLARNPLRDQFSAYVYSKTGYRPGVDLLRGIFNLVGKSDLYWEWVRAGGEHATIVSVDRDYMRKNLTDLFQRNWKQAINPLRWMQGLSEFGEQGTRLGEFIRGRTKGMSKKAAAFTSRNVTLDFAKMGSKIKTLNKITAFMNANIQGLNRPFQAFRERPGATWAKVISGITLPSIILYILNRKDKGYQELPRWQKDLFWIVRIPAKTPSGQIMLRIPKPFELGIIFGSVPERVLEFIDSKDPAAFDKLEQTIIEGAYLNPTQWIPTALNAPLENLTNWSFFREKRLETMGMERVIPEERYTAFTSETAKTLGRLLNYSPVKIENLITGYTGQGGRLALDFIDMIMTGGKRKLPATAETIPVVRGFVAKEPVGSFSQSMNTFYEHYERITKIYNTMQEANKKGDREKFNDLRTRYPDVNQDINKKVLQATKVLSGGRKKINEILDDDTLSRETRLQRIRDISVKMTSVAQQANSLIKGRKGTPAPSTPTGAKRDFYSEEISR